MGRTTLFILFSMSVGGLVLIGLSKPRERLSPEMNPAGIIILNIGRNSALEAAGLEPGDRLIAWERFSDSSPQAVAEQGDITTIFDWIRVRIEQAPRGNIRLRGERDGEQIEFEVHHGPWQARVAPFLSDVAGNSLEMDVSEWHAFVERNAPSLSWDVRCGILMLVGSLQKEQGDFGEARESFRAALDAAQTPMARAEVWLAIGQTHFHEGELDLAERAYLLAEEIQTESFGESLLLTRTGILLGEIAFYRSDLEAAQQRFQEILQVRQHLAPGSPEVADSLHNLGVIAELLGDLKGAADYLNGALAIERALAPDSHEMIKTLLQVGLVSKKAGDLESAAKYYKEASTICSNQEPECKFMIGIKINLGSLALNLGDVQEAKEYYEQAMERQPDWRLKAGTLLSLGDIAFEDKDWQLATSYYQHALQLFHESAPEGLGVADCHHNLGRIAYEQGNCQRAASKFHRALGIRRQIAPGGLQEAESQHHLGVLALDTGDFEEAKNRLEAALAIWQKKSPGSLSEAETWYQLGRLARKRSSLQEARSALQLALEGLELQIGRFGGSPDQGSRFRNHYDNYYRAYEEFLLEVGEPATAFHILERYRARALLAMLAERDLIFSEVPEELERQRREIAAQTDRVQQQLAEQPMDVSAGELVAQLHKLRRKTEEVHEAIRKAYPRLAELRQPQPLTAAEARAQLDPGTVLLSYSVGEEETYLFILSKEGGLDVATLPVGAAELRRQVEALVAGVRHAVPGDTTSAAARARKTARELYRSLLQPVESRLAAGERLLILPDGPLHRLPWAALLRPALGTAAGEEYLVQWKPIHLSVSATVYAQLRKDPLPRAETTHLVAFGNPSYPPLADGEAPFLGDPVLRSAVEQGWRFAPLPGTEDEVNSIASYYPDEPRVYLGKKATEEQAKAIGRSAKVVHFAAHGRLDERFPLNSGLVLSIPEVLLDGRDNGLLQVWEIFEQVRLDADVVVLSACESALGEEQGGEGLMGLTRAFHYAGARSVVATLWSVQDQATAELMIAFHRHLRQGKSKDEALRAAQLELIQGDHPAPYYWAGVQLYGDRR